MLLLRTISCWLVLWACGLANAQIQRSIVNPSFELPFTGPRAASLNPFFTSTNWVAVDAGEIPGWETTHPVVTNGCPAGGAALTPPYTCTPIEMWANSFLGVVPAQGRVLVELDAYQNSKLFQNICMNTGEVFAFNFAHRGRGGTDRAQFQIGAASVVILDVSTGTAGTGVINAGGGATSRSATGIANGWTRYAGNYTYTGASGVQRLGFDGISSSGVAGSGNLLDDINIALKPYVTFASVTSSAVEGATTGMPQFKVVGTVPAGGLSLTFTVAGSASFGSDFNYSGSTTLTGIIGNSTSLQVTVPAGNYSDALANNTFTLPINVISDTAIENNETIVLTMPINGAASNFVNANVTACGGAFNPVTTHTVIDNDIDLRATKSTNASGTLTVGDAVLYTLTFANVTPAVLTLAPLTAHDAATVTIADPAPAGITLGAWTCVATGTSCPAASGSGAIAQTVNLPVGASLVYQLQATMSPSPQCLQSVTNTASINTTALSPSGAGLTEGASVQGDAGYVFQTNTASVSHLVAACADVSISKRNGVNTLTAGQATTYTVIVSNAGPANANSALLKDPAAAGLSCTSVACTGSTGAASCGSLSAVSLALLQGSGIVLNNFPASSSYTFSVSCGVTATGL